MTIWTKFWMTPEGHWFEQTCPASFASVHIGQNDQYFQPALPTCTHYQVSFEPQTGNKILSKCIHATPKFLGHILYTSHGDRMLS